MRKLFRMIGFCLLAASIFSACESDDSKMAKIKVSLVDAPADYKSVLIDVADVKVNSGGWHSLDNVEQKVYDLLKLTNGEEAILGEIELPEGELQEIRLILGDNNKLGIDDVEVDLDTPSASQSGLKIKLNTMLEAGVTYKLVLDFDAAKSIVKAGNSGKYILKPVIRAEMEAQTGAIKGMINPIETDCVVYAILGTDSISTYPNEEGKFLIRALEQGTYRVVGIPTVESGLTKVTLDNVDVTVGEVTDVETLKFEAVAN
ncbi:DUF4382 domain-containing protein [Ancylomarina euxinus]|uniref:DUF4382 domain-containing protein n=1 Tax=Ancylomarina euxinus TaxID=2283627 RepID=A0A425XYC9_9BACT|nr:DUF4382 domain-containing protein [Ancylomarina euxinus]MCZ4695835.1 DUF4382 domain-containing protein [Ancylomarina euxinus]MUP16101.1 DUF4382 domain-containing protein [Ancylomarina euxinus]RRG19822.1 DUF4382 domain-containing protein [Ancylomarina euxinus]